MEMQKEGNAEGSEHNGKEKHMDVKGNKQKRKGNEKQR